MRRVIGFISVVVLAWSLSLPAAASGAHRAWIARFNGSTPFSVDEAQVVATSSNGGRIFVAGYSEGMGGLAVVAYRASGSVAWHSSPFEPPAGYDITDVNGLVVSSDDGEVVLTATAIGRPQRMIVAGFAAATGHLDWTWYPTPGGSQPAGIAAGPARIFVVASVGRLREPDWLTVALRPATGAVVWSNRYDDPYGAAQPTCIAFGGRRVFATGTVATKRSPVIRTVSYAARSGSLKWTSRYAGAKSGTLAGMSRDGSRVVVASGWTFIVYGARTGDAAGVERYRPAWRGQVIDVALNRAATRAFVTGSDSANADMTTAALNLVSGHRLWVSRAGAGGSDGGVGIVVSPSAPEVFVTGYTELSAFAWLTAAYDARTGAERWSDIYRGPLRQQGFPRAIAIGPLGNRVYVVGYATSTHSDDFATIAYAPG